ncbi:MAG TPA: galactose-1-phosphate uridylyltransferase [Chitinivibrionales bacterium]|nr:galactose-1-phosphate uridylyltransferase [Chitinivibrionales bacterium]
MNLSDFPHRRCNLLTGEWVLVSPHRTKRPWHGKVFPAAEPPAAAYDPKCFLCPGNRRAGSEKNPSYESTFEFDNDFAALLPDIPLETLDEQGCWSPPASGDCAGWCAIRPGATSRCRA